MAKATTTFAGTVGGLPVVVAEGTELPDGDPIVKAFADMFGKAPKRATHTHAPKKRTTKAKK
jgi:hypothetical protein